MIPLRFKKPHRSILSLPDTDLPDFSLITGINGSGKSHLLQAIKASNIEVQGIASAEITVFDWTTLVPTEAGVAEPAKLALERGSLVDRMVQILTEQKQGILRQISAGTYPFLAGIDPAEVLKFGKEDFLKLKRQPGVDNRRVAILETTLESARSQLRHDSQLSGFVSKLEERAKQNGVSLLLLNSEDIDEEIPFYLRQANAFQQDVTSIFAAYYGAWDEHRRMSLE